MNSAMFLSDTAIIIYEIAAILIMGFLIKKLSKEKKEFMRNKREQEGKYQEDMLKQLLANEKRR